MKAKWHRNRLAALSLLLLTSYVVAIYQASAAEPEPGVLHRDASGQVDIPMNPRSAYTLACATCHGSDGDGAPANQRGFDLPMPDFTDGNFATREGNVDWKHVAARGGPARAFSRMMPAMGDAMTEAEIERTLEHIRTFCPDKAWPRGELNLPRSLYTTKAYPEDEIVVVTNWDTTDGQESFTTEFFWEQRVGKRSQYEIILPYTWTETSKGWNDGVGDIGLGFKSALLHDVESGYIVSPGLELLLPTGDDDAGIGSGTLVIEPYLAYGQVLPAGFFAQTQVGGAIPYDGDEADEEVFARLNLGRTIYQDGYSRRWTPMVGLLYAEELNTAASGQWDIAPQLQITLSTRQHLRLGFGAKIPLNDTNTRDPQFTVYLLWDWFDGGFFEGW